MLFCEKLTEKEQEDGREFIAGSLPAHIPCALATVPGNSMVRIAAPGSSLVSTAAGAPGNPPGAVVVRAPSVSRIAAPPLPAAACRPGNLSVTYVAHAPSDSRPAVVASSCSTGNSGGAAPGNSWKPIAAIDGAQWSCSPGNSWGASAAGPSSGTVCSSPTQGRLLLSPPGIPGGAPRGSPTGQAAAARVSHSAQPPGNSRGGGSGHSRSIRRVGQGLLRHLHQNMLG